MHHDRVAVWLAGVPAFALCSVVEGALTRFVVRLGESVATARALLSGVHAHPRCEFWSKGPSYLDVDLDGVHGHRQVTDAYLAGVAAAHSSALATLDRSLVLARPPATLLVPELT